MNHALEPVHLAGEYALAFLARFSESGENPYAGKRVHLMGRDQNIILAPEITVLPPDVVFCCDVESQNTSLTHFRAGVGHPRHAVRLNLLHSEALEEIAPRCSGNVHLAAVQTPNLRKVSGDYFEATLDCDGLEDVAVCVNAHSLSLLNVGVGRANVSEFKGARVTGGNVDHLHLWDSRGVTVEEGVEVREALHITGATNLWLPERFLQRGGPTIQFASLCGRIDGIPSIMKPLHHARDEKNLHRRLVELGILRKNKEIQSQDGAPRTASITDKETVGREAPQVLDAELSRR